MLEQISGFKDFIMQVSGFKDLTVLKVLDMDIALVRMLPTLMDGFEVFMRSFL